MPLPGVRRPGELSPSRPPRSAERRRAGNLERLGMPGQFDDGFDLPVCEFVERQPALEEPSRRMPGVRRAEESRLRVDRSVDNEPRLFGEVRAEELGGYVEVRRGLGMPDSRDADARLRGVELCFLFSSGRIMARRGHGRRSSSSCQRLVRSAARELRPIDQPKNRKQWLSPRSCGRTTKNNGCHGEAACHFRRRQRGGIRCSAAPPCYG